MPEQSQSQMPGSFAEILLRLGFLAAMQHIQALNQTSKKGG